MKPDYVPILVECMNCHKQIQMHVSKSGLEKYQNGTLIQDALPELTPGERELMISHYCERCFDKLFNDN